MNDADKRAFMAWYLDFGFAVDSIMQEAVWQAACEWRDSQVGEPVATIQILTVGERKQVKYTYDPRTFGLTDGVHELYATPPTAQINQRLVEALAGLLTAIGKCHCENSGAAQDAAQAALQAVREYTK